MGRHFHGCLRAAYVAAWGVLGILAVWGFTVDDAWIVSRVAAHGVQGRGFAFNPGAVTDAVTPFGFAHFVAGLGWVLGRSEPLELWSIARAGGAVCVVVTLCGVGWNARTAPRSFWYWSPLWVVAGLSLFVWSGSGLATPYVATLLWVGGNAVSKGPQARAVGAWALGCAAALRPELAFFGAALLVARRYRLRHAGTDRAGLFLELVGFVCPVLFVMGARVLCFGHPLPLSSLAKQPDLQSGLHYAAVTGIWFSLGWALLLRRKAYQEGMVAAYLAHIGGLILVGGDWMPAFRLSAPLVPLLLGWHLSTPMSGGRRWALSLVIPVFPLLLLLQQGPDLRAVSARRLQLVQEGRVALAGATNVAAVDIGWVGLAHAGQVTDLAGVTDPRIAQLPGGHTSKQVMPGLFSARDVDAWVVRDLDRRFAQRKPGASRPDATTPELDGLVAAYLVDARLLRRFSNLHLSAVVTLPLAGEEGQYVVFRSLKAAAAEPHPAGGKNSSPSGCAKRSSSARTSARAARASLEFAKRYSRSGAVSFVNTAAQR